MSKVKSSAEFIANNSRFVTVNERQCVEVASEIFQKMKFRKYSPDTWSTHQLNPSSSDPNVIDWIFTVDTLNFSFWQDEPRFSVKYGGKVWTGYWSMVAAINKALDNGIPITDPKFWLEDRFTPELLRNVFTSNSGVEVPLFNERYDALKQAAHALAKSNFTSFKQVLELAGNSSMKLVEWLVTNIKSYNDISVYEGREVQLYKRAQILAADLWACGVAKFDDIDEITMFADYRVPQILVVLGCIEYSNDLKELIQSKQLLESGSEEEVEIRGCSIMAVELMVRAINKMGSNNVNAVLVDFYLWDTAKEEEDQNNDKIECHRTRSVYY